MDNSCCRRSSLPKSIYMGHYIMAYFFFSFPNKLIVNVCNMCRHFIDLVVCNGETECFLFLCEGEPKLSPCLIACIG